MPVSVKDLAVQATIISFYPDRIGPERKPGMIPNYYSIEPGDLTRKVPGLTHIESGKRSYFVGDDRPDGEEFVPASTLAESLVRDFNISSVGANLDVDIGPGLSWMPAIILLPELQKNHAKFLDNLYNRHINWYKAIVQIADNDWSRTRNHRAITKIQRTAAEFLKLEREWLTEQEVVLSMSTCPMCQTKVRPEAVKCFNCQYILNPERFAKLQEEQQKLLGAK